MLISPLELQTFFDVHPNGVLHIGAHRAEEAGDYLNLNWEGEGKIYWVEADPTLCEELKLSLDSQKHEVICAAAWHKDGDVREFIRTSSSQSNSLLELDEHLKIFPEIEEQSRILVTTQRIDNLLSKNQEFNLINLDTQGSELHVLIGVGSLLEQVQYIYCEVNTREIYKGCALLPEIDDFLSKNGFTRILTKWAGVDSGWGDALYVKNERLPRLLELRKYLFILSRARKLRNPRAIKNLLFSEVK